MFLHFLNQFIENRSYRDRDKILEYRRACVGCVALLCGIFLNIFIYLLQKHVVVLKFKLNYRKKLTTISNIRLNFVAVIDIVLNICFAHNLGLTQHCLPYFLVGGTNVFLL